MLSEVLNAMEDEKSNSFVVKEKGKLTRVFTHTIQYIESIKHELFFHLRGNEIISCYGTMNEFADSLLADKRFVKCHRSFIINMNAVVSISNNYFILVDKTLIPISNQYL
jgi:DNA-binding LytR/AlgR family response regulator